MHLKPILNRPLLIFFKVLTYSLTYVSIHMLLEWMGGRSMPYVAFVLSMLIIVPNRGKMTAILQRFVDRSFYYSQYRMRKSILDFEQDLNPLMDFDELTRKMNRFLRKVMDDLPYLFYVYTGSCYELVNPETGEHFIQAPEINLLPEPLHFDNNIRFHKISALKEDSLKFKTLAEKIDLDEYTYFLPLQAHNTLAGFLFLHKAIEYTLNNQNLKAAFLRLSGRGANLLENAQISSQIQRKSLESQLLLEVVTKITATLNLSDVLDAILDNLSQLMTYDAAAIFLVDKKQKHLEHTATRGYDTSILNRIKLKADDGVSGWAIQTQRGVIIPDVSKDPVYFALRPKTKSQITVPIISRDKAIGSLVAESNTLEHFSQEDLERLTLFSGLAAIAIRNAQLYEDSVAKKRMQSELVVASRVQQALLRKRFPTVPGVKIAVANVPSLIVGGDLYDIIRIDEDREGIAIGDVSGKGTPAAILMAVTYAAFKSLLKYMDPVSSVVARLNNLLYEATSPGYYVTFFYGIINVREKVIKYTNAGHNPPLLMRKDRSIELLDKGGTVLGFMPNQSYTRATVHVESGDYVILFTDGVTEIKNSSGEEFGEDQFIELLKSNYGAPPREMKALILKELMQYSGSSAYQDDLTLVIAYIE